MRKFIVRNFALNHISVIFGKVVNWVRVGNWAIPSMCIGGLYSIYTDMDFMNPIGMTILLVILLQNLIVFIYLRIKPVRYDELTLSQKWQYSKAYFSQQLTKELPKSEVEKILSEWDEVNRKFKNQVEGKRFYNILPLLINPVVMIVTAIVAIMM